MLDLGCGAGFGAVATAGVMSGAGFDQVLGTDVVERCLRFSRLNAALNGVAAEFRYSDVLSRVDGDFDLLISNTPCMWEVLQQATFATGGGSFGTDLPVRMLAESLARLRPGGLLVAVVSAPIIEGRPYVFDAMSRVCAERPAGVIIRPLLAEYELRYASVYRSHRISQLVRYLTVIRPAQRFTARIDHSLDLRYNAYRLRGVPAKAVAAVRNVTRSCGIRRH